MAGYKNSPGFSGGQVDNILEDYNTKTIPHIFSFTINDGQYPGTEENGIYPAILSQGTVGGFDFNEGSIDTTNAYKPVNKIFTFSFKNQIIYAQVQSIIRQSNATVYLIPFIAQDSTDAHNYHQYLLKIVRTPGSGQDPGSAHFQIRAVAQLS